MAGLTSKRVLVVRFDRESLPGFIDPNSSLGPERLELLSPAGELVAIPYTDIKAVCFVKDPEGFAAWKPNRVFTSRPKAEGLWVRFRFRDGDMMDGILPLNLLLWDANGFTISPPDPTFQNQRVFVPRSAVAETRVLGVVGQQRKGRGKPGADQLEMFDV